MSQLSVCSTMPTACRSGRYRPRPQTKGSAVRCLWDTPIVQAMPSRPSEPVQEGSGLACTRSSIAITARRHRAPARVWRPPSWAAPSSNSVGARRQRFARSGRSGRHGRWSAVFAGCGSDQDSHRTTLPESRQPCCPEAFRSRGNVAETGRCVVESAGRQSFDNTARPSWSGIDKPGWALSSSRSSDEQPAAGGGRCLERSR